MFDIEVDELDPDKFINVVAALEPTFGGINLEDIKAPECFYIEQKLRERMNIPVFHDDQHGTAIISTAAILNGLRVVEKNLSDVRMVVSGAGAAAIACMNLLVALGMQKHNIVVCDSKGVIYKDREANMAETKAAYAVEDDGNVPSTMSSMARTFSWLLRAESSDPGDGQENGALAADPRSGEPGAGNPAAAGEGSARRRDYLYRPFRLSKPVNNVLCFRSSSAARWMLARRR